MPHTSPSGSTGPPVVKPGAGRHIIKTHRAYTNAIDRWQERRGEKRRAERRALPLREKKKENEGSDEKERENAVKFGEKTD